MPSKRLVFLSLLIFGLVSMALMQTRIQSPGPDIVVGRNVNMVSGTTFPGGDPYLQRQNEPSIAVSSRNALTLLAGANDYRAVDYIDVGELPGQEPVTGQSPGDAWLGLFKSFNGGQTWTSTLLPGCKYNLDDPQTSPLYGFDAAADPTVRSGPNGMFYYSGIAFDRIKNGRSVYFISRFIDNNNLGYIEIPSTQGMSRIQDINEDAILDSIDEVDTRVLYDGTSGQFTDKPWIAVDVPRNSQEVLIRGNGFPDQWIPSHNVYCVLSIFLGNLGSDNVHNKILFFRSTDCGNTWEQPIKLSEGERRNQGTIIDISPEDGTIYVAWRRFEAPMVSDAILVCKSTDQGRTFNKPVEIATFDPFPYGAFDQGTTEFSFRTSALPALAVAPNGNVYAAWSQRVEEEGWQARIMMSTSTNGINWNDPVQIDHTIINGFQFQPSATCAAGKFLITWVDTRRSQGGYGPDISDFGDTGLRHTIDIWVAEASPSLNPTFTSIKQVSRYLYSGEAPGNNQINLQQLPSQFNRPNFPMFMDGTAPFIGDYIDISPAPMFLPSGNGGWRFNTGSTEKDPAVFHVTWTDNRDVKMPPTVEHDTPAYWKTYAPPGSTTLCDTTGRRDQNIYTSQLTEGTIIGSPGNTKPLTAPEPSLPLEDQKRTFLVFAKNLANESKAFELAIDPSGSDIYASFWQFGLPEEELEDPWISWEETNVKVWIEPYSSLTMTVFVDCVGNSHPDRYASLKVHVKEIEKDSNGDWIPASDGFQGHIPLNPDPVNTEILDAHYKEIHTPIIQSIALDPIEFEDSDSSDLLDGSLTYFFEDPDASLGNVNPDIVNPNIRSPNIRSDNLVNPNIRSTNFSDINFGEVTDLRWTVKNSGNTASAYSFTPVGEVDELPTDIETQLLIYRVSSTPTWGCDLGTQEHNELIMNISNPNIRSPNIRSPNIRSPNIRSPNIRSNTFFLAPGETAVISLRLIESNPHSSLIEDDYAQKVAGAVTPQATNYGEIEPAVASSLFILSKAFTDLEVNEYFEAYLEAYGGTYFNINEGDPTDPNDDVWEYRTWRVKPGELLPNGLTLDPDGRLWGTPTYDPQRTYVEPENYIVTVEVDDESDPTQTARRVLQITISCEFFEIKPTADPGGSISPSDDVVRVPQGEDQTFTITPDFCFHVSNVIIDLELGGETHLGAVTTHTFYDVRAEHTIQAVFERDTFTIEATADPGGTIDPEGEVIVDCGLSQKFTITPDEGYVIQDVLVNGDSEGPISEFEFINVQGDHMIHATFAELQQWAQRYNNSPVNDNDEPSDMAIDAAGNIHVTGYSIGRTTGPDFYTISYNPAGNAIMNARDDGPSHEGDKANAITVDESGNVYIAGESIRGQPRKHSDYLTVKYDNTHEQVWDERYDARRNGNDVATAIVYHDGFVYVTGRSEDSESKKSDVLHYDYFTVKYNALNGRMSWDARYNNLAEGQDEATAMAVDSAGNVFVTGRSEGNGTGFDIVTIKYLPDGTPDPDWGDSGIARFDRGFDDEAVAIALNESENLTSIYVTGLSSNNADRTDNDVVTMKYLANGTLDPDWGDIGIARFDRGFNDIAAAISLHKSDVSTSVFVTGYSAPSADGTVNDYVTIKYLPDGTEDPNWGTGGVVIFDGGADDRATDMAINFSGEIYITGKSIGSASDYDYYTIKYDASGKIAWRARYYNENYNGADEAVTIVIGPSGAVYVTGRSARTDSDFDYATVKYREFN